VSNEPRLPPRAPGPLPARFWQTTARIAAGGAVVALALHPDAALVSAGLLAAATAIAAHAEACFRARRGQPSDLADVLATGLALATVLMCLLGLAAASRPP
jgi:hypothetical protein